jgi:ribosome maturation factor RimP
VRSLHRAVAAFAFWWEHSKRAGPGRWDVDDALQQQIEARVAALGFELVELEQAGSKTRPILRLRIERENATPDQSGVTLEDCTHVSREVESLLDNREDLSERYVLEVSSPGVERPLIKPRDFERFAGQEVSIKTSEAVGELGKRVEGMLKGIKDDVVMVDIDGNTVEIARRNIKKAHLVFKWGAEKKP